MIDWKKYFDHIFCLHYAGHPDKLPRITNELKRVGIYDSGIFSWHVNISGPLIDRMQSVLPLHPSYYEYWPKPGYTNAMLGHYWMLKECQLAGYNRFLILENDILFLKDLNSIKLILDNTPSDMNLVLYDYVVFYTNAYEHKQLGKFSRVTNGIFHNATAYTMSPAYRDAYLNILEQSFVPVDDLYNRIDRNGFYISDVNMCIHSPFGKNNSCNSNVKEYTSAGLDLSLYEEP